MIEANIPEPNDDDMKIEEDEIDEIIKKSTKRKSTFVSENLREKMKDFESSFDSEVKVFEKRPLHSRERFKKANTDKVFVKKRTLDPTERLKKVNTHVVFVKKDQDNHKTDLKNRLRKFPLLKKTATSLRKIKAKGMRLGRNCQINS